MGQFEVRFGYPSGWFHTRGTEVTAASPVEAVYTAYERGGGHPLSNGTDKLDPGPHVAYVRPILTEEVPPNKCVRHVASSADSKGLHFGRVYKCKLFKVVEKPQSNWRHILVTGEMDASEFDWTRAFRLGT